MSETPPKPSPKKTSRSIRSRRYETLSAWRFSSAPPKKQTENRSADQKDQQSPLRQGESESKIHGQHQSLTDRMLSTESTTSIPRGRESSDSPISEIGSILDPFCVLPSDLPKEDQQLLQFYISYLPLVLYGTRSDAIFSSIRDVSLINTLKSPLVMQWMVVSAQGLMIALRGGQEPVSFFRRKAMAYLTLKDQLEENSGDQLSDDFINGIIMATVAESRTSSPGVSNIHLKAYEAVIAARGGLRAILLASPTPMLLTSHFMPFIVNELPPSELVFRRDHFDQALEVLQFMAKGHNTVDPSKLIFSTTAIPRSQPRSPSLKLTLDGNLCPPLMSRAFAPFLQPDTWEYPRYAKISSHFLALFIIVSTLWKLRGDSSRQQSFIDRIDHLFIKSSAQDRFGRYLLNLEGFGWVVVKAGFEVYETLVGDNGVLGNSVDMVVDAICGLKLLMVCCESVRRKMIAFLCRCLVDVREIPGRGTA